MDQTEIIKTLVSEHQRVIDFYYGNSDVFNYSGRLSSAKYAFTELAEVIDAKLRSELPGDLRRASKEIDYDEEIGDTLFMLLASLGISPEDREESMYNIRKYLKRESNDEIYLVEKITTEELNSLDYAIAICGENISAALMYYPGNYQYCLHIINAIACFDWKTHGLDKTMKKFAERCEVKRIRLQIK